MTETDYSALIRKPGEPKAPPPQDAQPPDGNWLLENVWNPAVNGTGVIQIYNTFANEDLPLRKTQAADLGSTKWAIQTLAGAGGAILPYVAAGKLAGKGLHSTANSLGLRGTSARLLTHEATANILGAGAYEALKNPLEGETRLGNSIGVMAGFGVFEGGNRFLGKSTASILSKVDRSAALGVGRFGVGAAGGVVTYDTAHSVAGLLGEKDNRDWNGRLHAALSGGFINVALPVVHDGATRAIDYGFNSRSFGPGIPVQRYIGYQEISDPHVLQAAHMNPAARVKVSPEGQTKADVKANVVHVTEHNAPKLAHELRHLAVAREIGPQYKAIAELTKTDPTQAELSFYNMRAYAEFQARLMEAMVNGSKDPAAIDRAVGDAGKIGEQTASNGKTYQENWNAEWQQFQKDNNFRPRFEYDQGETKTESAGEAKPAEGQSEVKTAAEQVVIGRPEPLGPTVTESGTNFAVRSKGATQVELLMFDEPGASQPVQTLPMFKTGDVWHRFVEGAGDGSLYLFRAFGPYNPAIDGTRFNPRMALIDPYAKALTGENKMPTGYDSADTTNPDRHLIRSEVDKTGETPKSVVVDGKFDWQGDKPPNIRMEDTVIYELNVRGFTGKAEDLGNLRGTYRGLIEKIPHLKKLGVTAVELMPVMEYAKTDWNRNPDTGELLQNAWGYQTIAFQAPEGKYAADGTRGQQVAEFKNMVRELHKNDIEVILDIVFNHTGEASHLGPTLSFRGLDNNVYYMLLPDKPEFYIDHTGCKNTVNCNEPGVQKLIVDTLKYWTNEMHVDGFRFDLATVFNYDVDNVDRAKTPIIKAIESEPDLARVKLIAEPWSISNYKVGRFSDQRWAEWNGLYRDAVRRFVKSDEGMLASMRDAITGYRNMFDPANGRNSINFVTAHDGFTLNDLVTYAQKHNWKNGEKNNDGTNDNYSWNWGVEGPVEKSTLPEAQRSAIEATRVKLIKNMLSLLFLSQGTPMMYSGDEFRRTSEGNNNYWAHDDLNMVDWGHAKKHADVLRFTEEMIGLRKRLQLGHFKPEDVVWHGTKPFDQKFDSADRFLAWQVPAKDGRPSVYSAFNSYWGPLEVQLPPGRWRRLVDTSLAEGSDIVRPENGAELIGGKYIVNDRTGVIFESVPDGAPPSAKTIPEPTKSN